jgi:thiamine biosynthesis lipoprotein
MSATPSRRRFLKIAAIHSLAWASLSESRAATAGQIGPQRWRGIALGGEVGIDLFGAGDVDDVFKKCRREMLRLERIFSLYVEDSALSRLNRSGQLRDAPVELIEVLQFARKVSEITAGAFDVTVHPLCEVLASGVTADVEIEDARRRINFRALEIVGKAVKLTKSGMAVTLNGVAQGYITDRITTVLAEHGYTAALVDMGEKRALGPHPENRPWRVGVRSPEGGTDELAGVFDLPANRAIATSGGYGQLYAAAGRHHLVDARDGLSRQKWRSVSVIASNAMTADALSTALAVSEPDRAQRILQSFPVARPQAKILTATGTWISMG